MRTASAVQMRRAYEDMIADTLRYCAAHCDDEKESEVVAWVAEIFAEMRPVRIPQSSEVASA